jgi:molybdopterin-guanine dinucleotide biosynthesis protein A
VSAAPAASRPPIGAVLAGGAGSRLAGAKPTAMLGGRPLLRWVLAALTEVIDEVVVVAKAQTPLPTLPDSVPVWREPAEPVHPLAGIAWALEHAGGRAVLACPLDLPLLTPAGLAAVRDAPGAVAVADGQPLLGRFPFSALARLRAAIAAGDSARVTVTGLDPVIVPLPGAQLFNVNTPADLAAAEAMLADG